MFVRAGRPATAMPPACSPHRLIAWSPPSPPGPADVFDALDEQTVVVPGTGTLGVVIPSPARSLAAVHEQRRALEAQIGTLLEAHPLHPVQHPPRPGRGQRRGRRPVHPAAGGRAARSVAARRAQPARTASRALARRLRPGARVHRRSATRHGSARPDRHHRRAHRHSGDRARRVRAVTGSARSVPPACALWRQPCSGRASPWEHSTSSPSPQPNVTTPSTSRR